MANSKQPAPQPPDINAIIQAAASGLSALGGGTSQFLGLPTNANLAGTGLEQTLIAGQKDAQGNTQPYPNTQIAPRYYKGAEWLPVMGGATPQEIARLQQQLVSAGLINNDYHNGVWDGVSQNAFQYLLEYANNAGTDYQTALSSLQNAETMTIDPVTGQPVVKKKGVKAITLQLTNPDDVATTAQNVAQQFIGRPLSTQELERFQNVWKQEESGYQRDTQMDQASGGGTTTKPADMSTEAQRFAANLDPVAYQGQQAVQLVQHLNNMLGGISGLGQPKSVTQEELGVK